MRFVLLLSSLLLLPAFQLSAQAPPNAPACNGDLEHIRISEIKPGGTMQGFMNAVDAHRAWYRANGITSDEIFAVPLRIRDEQTHEWKISDKQAMSFHINPPDKNPNEGNESWKAFVKQYQDNSKVISEYTICMPKNRQ